MSMLVLLLGLLLFLGVHSLRALAPGFRDARIQAWGPTAWKLGYSLLSLAGLLLIIHGYGIARAEPVLVWSPPMGMRHLAALLTLPAFILLAATYVPRNHFKARLGHPMLLAVKLWALAHLLAVGWLHAIVLTGAFLAWAVFAFRQARRRQPAAGAAARPTVVGSSVAVIIGALAWGLFALHLHLRLIGVAPFA
jgi:uncharacterized membrane protein